MGAEQAHRTKNSFAAIKATLLLPRFYVNFAVLAAAAFFWIVLNPFRVLELEIPPFNRAMAAIGAYLDYPESARDKITVLTMDENDEFLKRHGWPLPIDQWRQLLGRLSCLGPKAIMVDVLLYKPDSRPGEWPDLVDAVEKIAAGNFDCPGRRGLADKTAIVFARGGAQGRLGSDRIADRDLAVTEWHAESGYPLAVRDADDHTQDTAAFALFRRLCSGEEKWSSCPSTFPSSDDDSIKVFWGLKIPTDPVGLLRPSDCPDDGKVVLRTFGDLFRSIFEHGPGHFQHCSYHRRVTIEQMDAIHENCLALTGKCRPEDYLFKDKVVFIGAHLNNITDTVYSPIHDGLDGVFYHAMAFDNLLVFGKDYYQDGLVIRLWCWGAALIGLFVACFLGAHSVPARRSVRKGFAIAGLCAILPLILGAVLIHLRLLLPADSQIVFGLLFTFLAVAGAELELREILIHKLESAKRI